MDRKKSNYEGVTVESVDQDYNLLDFDRIVIANSNEKQREEIRKFLVDRMVLEEKIYSAQPILNT